MSCWNATIFFLLKSFIFGIKMVEFDNKVKFGTKVSNECNVRSTDGFSFTVCDHAPKFHLTFRRGGIHIV